MKEKDSLSNDFEKISIENMQLIKENESIKGKMEMITNEKIEKNKNDALKSSFQVVEYPSSQLTNENGSSDKSSNFTNIEKSSVSRVVSSTTKTTITKTTTSSEGSTVIKSTTTKIYYNKNSDSESESDSDSYSYTDSDSD